MLKTARCPSPHFSAIYYPNASCYLSLWVVVICSGYPHCAPLERGGWAYRYSIDISLRWSEKLNKSTNPKFLMRTLQLIPDTHCAPLEREGWTYRHSIDIPPRWSGIYAAVKIGIGGCKSSIVSFALEERKAEQINYNNRKRHHQFITGLT